MRAFILIILIFSFLPVKAQDSTRFESDAYRFADAVVYTYTQPLRWKQKDIKTLAVVLAGTAALTLLDEPAQRLFNDHIKDFPDEMETVGYHFGKPYSAFAVTGAFYLVGVVFNDKWSKDTGINLGATLLTSGLLQTVLKDVVGRARPGSGQGNYRFEPLSGSAAYHSFPSGHFAVALGISVVLAERIESKPIKIALYSLAATTALSRMHSNDHWLSDIAFGGVLAWFCNKSVVERLKTPGKRNLKRDAKVTWSISPSSEGVLVQGRF